MNVNDVAQREILDFQHFLKKVHDNTYKPLAPANQSEGGLAKSGLHDIKREPAYDFVGYADAVFANKSKIDVPGIRVSIGKELGMADATGFGTSFNMGTNESESVFSGLKKLSDF
jgi:hypothetical protein